MKVEVREDCLLGLHVIKTFPNYPILLINDIIFSISGMHTLAANLLWQAVGNERLGNGMEE